MNLYHLSQSDQRGYDTYSDCVVAAENEDVARLIRPGYADWDEGFGGFDCWARKPELVTVEFIGTAASHVKAGIVCASFHAG